MLTSRRFPRYAWLGLAVMVVSEIGLTLQVEPFWSWHTPIAWTGYILCVDGFVWMRRGRSWLVDSPHEFAFLAAASIPLWLVFEFYNLFIENWRYINLPDPLWLRYFGYAWSFATIWPAIFETGDAIAAIRAQPPRESVVVDRIRTVWSPLRIVFVLAGLVMLGWPLLWPSPYLAAPVWLGFIFLLEPINAAAGGESLLTDRGPARRDRLVNLAGAGLVCGVVWEFWNYWSRAKWIYTVPILPEVRVFEMPVPGYLGFPAFALECFAMYVTLRLFVWRGPGRPISL